MHEKRRMSLRALVLRNAKTSRCQLAKSAKKTQTELAKLATREQVDKISEEQSKMREEQAKMRKIVNRLRRDFSFARAVSPAQALSRVKRTLVPMSKQAAGSAIRQGASATWTFVVRPDGRLFAIGCAHTAFYYNTVSRVRSFVSLPLRVVQSGVENVYVHRELLTCMNPLKTGFDFVAVEIKQLPAAMTKAVMPVWKDTHPIRGKLTGIVAGYSHSCTVLGESLWRVDVDGSPSEWTFVESQGEPGNSGSLMFGFTKNCSPMPLGVYCGVAREGAGGCGKVAMRPRGRICPLPRLGDLVKLSVADDTAPIRLEVHDAHTHRECRFDGTYLIDGDGCEWPGVCVTTKIAKYTGSFDAGSCRSL